MATVWPGGGRASSSVCLWLRKSRLAILSCGAPIGRATSLPLPCVAVGGDDLAASCPALAPVGLGPPPVLVAGQGEGGGVAGKSVEDAALVTGHWSQESAANSASAPAQSGQGTRPVPTAPVADEQ